MEKENVIDQETFDSIRELSQIQMQLSDARVAFENLKKTEEEYLKQREVNVSEKLDRFVKSLEDGYKTFSENKDTFERIKYIISSFAEKATTLTAEVKDISAMLTEKIRNADVLLNSKIGKITDESNRIMQERGNLKAGLEEYNQRLRTLGEAEIKLNNEKIAFEERWKTLNN